MRSAAAAVGAIVLAAMLFSWAAVYNGYPLMYADSGTYVESSFTLHVPPDRPVAYSLFLRAVCGGRSLWPAVFCQSLLLAFLLHALFRRVAPRCGTAGYIASCALLAALTGLPWVDARIFADSFTADGLLCLLLLLLPGGSAAETVACAAIFLLSSAVHASHPPVYTVAAAAGAALGALLRVPRAGAARCALLVFLIAVSWFLVPAINLRLEGEFTVARAGCVIPMGRIWENGILRRFLDEHCGEGRYRFCEYRDEVRGGADYFLWDRRSPLYRTGGWNAPHDEYRRILIESLRDYPLDWARESAGVTLRQLVLFDAGESIAPLTPATWAYRVLEKRYPGEFPRFLASRQQRGALHLRAFRLAQYASVAASLALIIGMLRRPPRDGGLLRFVFFFGVAGVVANAAVCSSLVTAADRYGARVVWLIPLCCLLMVAGGRRRCA